MAAIGPVIVVGGGIAGLAMAAALAKVGVPARVFEQAAQLREVGAGVGLWSNAVVSLKELGAADAVVRSCQPLRIMAGANERGETLSRVALDDLGAEFASAACFVVRRPLLLSALASVVPSGAVVTGRRVVRLVADGRGVEFEDGGVEHADVVIGADGLHSVVRPFVVGADRVRYSGQTCFRGIARLRPPEPGVLREVQGRGQRGAVCPLDDETVYWFVAHNAPEDRIVPASERKATLAAMYRGWPFGLPDAIAATADDAILQNDLVDRPPARTYVRGPAVLVGDAAHPTTPNLGQGANMAIDDAIALARALRDEPTVGAAYARYERERLRRTGTMVRRSWSFGAACRWTSPAAVAFREAMVRHTPSGVLRRALRDQILESVGPL